MNTKLWSEESWAGLFLLLVFFRWRQEEPAPCLLCRSKFEQAHTRRYANAFCTDPWCLFYRRPRLITQLRLGGV